MTPSERTLLIAAIFGGFAIAGLLIAYAFWYGRR